MSPDKQSERPYLTGDLIGLKRSDLVGLIQRQQGRWPVGAFGKFQPHKTNMDKMKDALTRVGSSFTTDKPLRTPDSSFSCPLQQSTTTAISVRTQVSHNPIASSATGQPAQVTQTAPQSLSHSYRSITLLVDDIRSNEKISQSIQVSIRSTPSTTSAAKLQADSEAVLNALQNTISAIKGPARIGIMDPDNSGYTIFFSTIVGPGYDQPAANPIWLEIPPSGSLKLIVSHIGGMKVPTKRVHSGSTPDGMDGKTDQIEHELPSSSKKSKLEPDPLSAAELLWITDAAQRTPGFEEFKQNQNRRLSDADRAEYWRFATAFSGKYYKTNWPTGLELSGGKTIKKNAIEAALGMKTTMLAQAINMTRIINVYTQGPHGSDEVVKKVSSTDSELASSTALASFLTQWEKTHPISVHTT